MRVVGRAFTDENRMFLADSFFVIASVGPEKLGHGCSATSCLSAVNLLESSRWCAVAGVELIDEEAWKLVALDKRHRLFEVILVFSWESADKVWKTVVIIAAIFEPCQPVAM